ncbi:MAG: 30S ribosomal protein S16 [Candidatus Omnitrophota bacterium]|nr:30S ribosomal protein S16 [Candidatus Omnitrophota bacterium]
MLRIRLRRPGKVTKGRYHSKIVVMERQSARDARFIEELGYYDPSQDLLKLDVGLYEAWVSKGAQPTDTVKSLYKKVKKAAGK